MEKINWEQLTVGRVLNTNEYVSRSDFFVKLGGMFYRPRSELNFMIKHLERKGFVEKFRIGNGDYFYRRKHSTQPNQPIFNRPVL